MNIFGQIWISFVEYWKLWALSIGVFAGDPWCDSDTHTSSIKRILKINNTILFASETQSISLRISLLEFGLQLDL